jgi:tetratricopeptide (TPR) repeat protein
MKDEEEQRPSVTRVPVTQKLLRTKEYNVALRQSDSTVFVPPPAPSTLRPPLPPAPPRPKRQTENVRFKVDKTKTRHNDKNTASDTVPLGHTSFSWLTSTTASSIPLGHTTFSWNAVLENSNVPPLAKILRLRGNKLFTTGEYHEAIIEYEKGLSAIPTEFKTERSMLHLNLAAVYIRLNRLSEAEVSATNATRLNPSNPKSWYRLAKVLELAGKLTEAIETLETGILVVQSKKTSDALLQEKTNITTGRSSNSTSALKIDKTIKPLKSLLQKFQSRMIHQVHTSKSKTVASKPLDTNNQVENLNKLNINILQSKNNTNGSGARKRPSVGIPITPYKLGDDLPKWYLDHKGKDRTDLPKLTNIAYVSDDEQEDLNAVEIVKEFFKLEKEKFAPTMRKYALIVQNCVDLKDLKLCKNPFAKHNRPVFCKAAELLACDIMATDKLSAARKELNNLDPLATLLVLFSVVRMLPNAI